MSQGNTVATTILAQLGGAGRLSAMIGAYNFMSAGRGMKWMQSTPERSEA
jgi:hypothetical protein